MVRAPIQGLTWSISASSVFHSFASLQPKGHRHIATIVDRDVFDTFFEPLSSMGSPPGQFGPGFRRFPSDLIPAEKDGCAIAGPRENLSCAFAIARRWTSGGLRDELTSGSCPSRRFTSQTHGQKGRLSRIVGGKAKNRPVHDAFNTEPHSSGRHCSSVSNVPP